MKRQLNFVILSNGPDNLRELRDALHFDQRTRLLAGGEDAEQFYREVSHLRPSAAIITIDHAQPEATFALIGRCSAAAPDTIMICASEDHSSELILRSLRAGAHEFLRLPINADELGIIVDRTAAFYETLPAASRRRGHVTSVFSNKGGCGTSFIAANLAAALAGQTVIVDLNQQAGGLDLYLGAEPKFSINQLAQRRAQLDDALLATHVAPLSDKLALLAAPREPTLTEEVKPEDVYKILELLRERYDDVVLDLPHVFDLTTLAALDQTDDIILVLTLDLPAVRCAQSTLGTFDRLGYAPDKVHVVVNRWSKMIEIDAREVERCLGRAVTGWVPSNYRSVVESINLGRPLIASDPSSPVSQQIRAIAARVRGAGSVAGNYQPHQAGGENFANAAASRNSSAATPTSPSRGFLRSLFSRRAAAAGTTANNNAAVAGAPNLEA